MKSPRPLRLVPVLALVLAASCVAQPRYDEALRTSRHYQHLYQDQQTFLIEMEAENQRLRAQLEAVDVTDAAYTREIDARMAELEKFLASLGQAAGDVTRFEIDGGYGYSLRDAVLFDTAVAEVRTEGRDVLKKLAAEIAKDGYRKIWIRGHTDSVPVVKAETQARFPYGNLQLSAERAMQVAGYLMKDCGLDEKRFVVAGHGPSEPVAANDTAENRQKNRRVEILVFDADAPAPTQKPASAGNEK
jgi:chemotaxis protein MotB